MKHSIEAAVHVQKLTKAIKKRGLRCGKAFRAHCARIVNAAQYLDLEDIHKEIEHKKPLSWGQIDSSRSRE